ncbi:MAG: Stp1/IreP family PP2C-type Ser/Thr phosphatase [Acidimicrobiales bacterium]|nr:Stp1/IreP family PP2C-type Ser/Thr phosphatase [Actinomycetota bacterium]
MTTLRAGSATDVGQVRSNNQDSLFLAEAETLYGVADGMGGHQGGEVASAMAVELVERHATERTLDSLRQAVRVANRAIFEKAGADRDLHGMGTTLVALRVVDGPDGDEIAWVNVGDSRVYLLRDDKLIQLSHDHSLVEDLLRDGQLTEDEAAVHPQRNILTRALGIDLDVQVDGATVLPFTGDRFLLCSDGLFNEVSSDQMASVLRRLADPGEAASELVRLANEGGGRDNITVVVVDVVDDGGRSAAASALMAADASRLVSPGPEADPTAVPAEPPAEEELFAGRRSSLPVATDDYGAEVDDPFGELDHARTRRITWRVLAFVVLLLLVLGVVVGAIGWSASKTYFVTFEGDRVAVFRGQPGGVLFFDPQLEDTTEITRDEVPPAIRPAIEAGKEFGSRSAADRYLINLQTQVDDAIAATSTTTSTSTSTSTTAPATTAPPTTAAPTTVP